MTALAADDIWTCTICNSKAIKLKNGYRGRAGHIEGVCRSCSTKIAEEALKSGDDAISWLVDDLRDQLRQERHDRAEDARYEARGW